MMKPFSDSAGLFSAHIFLAAGHLVRNLQPEGGSEGLGISPFKIIRSLFAPGSGTGTADNSAFV